MRLNLGSGGHLLEGYINVDMHMPADVRGDVRELDFHDAEEVIMTHLLEHLPHRDVIPLLMRIRTWMRPGARITVEVPDMGEIMRNPHALWPIYVYGSQDHECEFHKTGFTQEHLHSALERTGFSDVQSRSFFSEHPSRYGMPCIEAIGLA